MLRTLLYLLVILLFFIGSAYAQESERAASSSLTSVSLPADAQRILPASVPAEVSQTLEKLASAGGGKMRRGDSEVLIWAGANYAKKNAWKTIDRFKETLAFANWKYETGGEADGVTVFSLLKNSGERRAIIGFYGATDDALVIAMTEVLANETPTQTVSKNEPLEMNFAAKNSVVGVWQKQTMSMLQDRNTVTGATTPGNGMNLKFTFHPNGRFEFVGYLQSTMYGCTTDLFNDKQGRYTVSGGKITLTPSKNYWKNTYSCSPASNKERNYTLESETYEIAFKTDEKGAQNVCLTNAKGETCYRREKE